MICGTFLHFDTRLVYASSYVTFVNISSAYVNIAGISMLLPDTHVPSGAVFFSHDTAALISIIVKI